MSNENEKLTTGAQTESTMLVGARKMTFATFVLEYNALIILVLLVVASAIISPLFLTRNNLVNILRQQTSYLIIAMGMLMCLLTGGIDLSVASTVGFGSIMITQLVLFNGFGIIPAILLTLLLCACIGALNGFLVAYLKMAPFIVTLAMSFGIQGVVFIITRGMNQMLDVNKIAESSRALVRLYMNFGQNSDPFIRLPWRVYLTALIVLFFWFLLKYTSFGRLSTATGSNPVAVTLAGINIKKYKLTAYIICSFLGGLAGILITASNGSSSPSTTGGDYAMTAIAGTILGGADLGGGKGSVPFTVVGIFIMGMINNIMSLSNVPAYPQWCVKAAIIIFAIFLRSVVNARNSR
ncbi:MAG: ABC transporter permease [Clostridiales bacterium]|nr:ABC transporter permease [Clostridiales bacterium]